jgi:glycosyltransferase involved in cell wall biosynthesis
MKPVLVSILMPAYNGEVYIEQAIESVIAQTHQNWELIIVDDGSTDSTAAIVTGFKDPRIRYTYQENRGQAAALNRGLEMARGDYVTTLDTDDWLTSNSLLDRANFLDQHPEIGVVYGDGYYCDVTGKPLRRFSEHRVGDVVGDVYDTLITTPFFGTGGNVMVRRQIFDQYEIRYDESIVWCQDYDIYIRIAEKAAFGVVDAPTLWYRMHDTNMTMSMHPRRRLESLIQTRFKVLASQRFAQVSGRPKIRFFYQLLVQELHGRVEAQTTVVESPHFQSLPKREQARLLRLTANDYLFWGDHLDFARVWLRKARCLAPFDPKTFAASALASLNPDLTRRIVRYWRQIRSQNQKQYNPFDVAKAL